MADDHQEFDSIADAVDHLCRTQKETARTQHESLARLLNIQVDEAQIRSTRERTLTRALGFLVAVMTAGAGGGVYAWNQEPTQAQIRKDAEPVVEAVDQRVHIAEEKIERLKDVALEQQVQIADSVDYISQKIDAISPRRTKDVAMPESLKAAKRKATAIKQRKEALFEDSDPFVGIAESPR